MTLIFWGDGVKIAEIECSQKQSYGGVWLARVDIIVSLYC